LHQDEHEANEGTAMTVTTAKWTVDDYHRMIEAGILDDRNVELLNGQIIEMSPEGRPHVFFLDRFANRLRKLLGDQAQVREGHPITLPGDSEPEPDIAVVAPLDEEYLDHHPYPNNIFWIVEYADSSLKKDLEAKAKVYAVAGIRDYWVVNLKDRQVVIFRDPMDDTYQSQVILRVGTISPIAFPDLTIDVLKLMSR